MLVDDTVFGNLLATRINTSPIATPGVLSMVALKLHAISQPTREDKNKDWSDVIALIRAHDLSLDDPDLSATVTRHGGQGAIEKIRNAGLG